MTTLDEKKQMRLQIVEDKLKVYSEQRARSQHVKELSKYRWNNERVRMNILNPRIGSNKQAAYNYFERQELRYIDQ